ncbi:hypothetical protein GGF32_004095 [Allomyces javanicus]|nr:hypothetical protein GGF32_004095 [Allomyces javanicus]
MLVVLSLIVAVSVHDVSVVLEVTGGVSAWVLKFISPEWCWLRLTSSQQWKSTSTHSASIKVDNIFITATVDGDKTTLYDGATADLTAEQKDVLVSLFTINDHDEVDNKAKTLPREATFHARFFAPEGVSPDVAGFVKAVLEYCDDDVEDDDTDADKDALATRDAPDMAGLPPRGGMRGRGEFRGIGMQGPGGMDPAGGMGPGSMGPGGMAPGGMSPGGMSGFPHDFPGHQSPFGEHSPHGGPHAMPFGPGAPFGGAHRMPDQWQYQGNSKHGAIALAMDIREI